MVIWFAREFLFRTTTPDLAKVHGVGRGFDLLLLLLFALIVSLGIKLVGTLLMGALTIIPAAIAKNVVKSMKRFIAASIFLGGFISVTGLFIAETFSFLPGPSIILFGVGLFLISIVLPSPMRS
jgi:ABC-type Mn2+/Zn2+ transport system permease subunit